MHPSRNQRSRTIAPTLMAATFNYDESKVPAYQLPDPLLLTNGERVSESATWTQKRRTEILELFRNEMFGRRPSAPVDLKFKVFDKTPGALGGKATRKQITIYFSADEKGPRMDLLLYIPTNATQPVPAFLGLNFAGNQAIHADPGIKMSSSWMTSTSAAASTTSRLSTGNATSISLTGISAARRVGAKYQ